MYVEQSMETGEQNASAHGHRTAVAMGERERTRGTRRNFAKWRLRCVKSRTVPTDMRSPRSAPTPTVSRIRNHSSLRASDELDEIAASSAGPTYLPQPLSRNGHVASFFGYVKLPVRLAGGERERIPCSDGGSVVLHWWSVARSPVRAEQPIVLLVPGINNHSDTPYLQYQMRHLEEQGFMAAIVVPVIIAACNMAKQSRVNLARRA